MSFVKLKRYIPVLFISITLVGCSQLNTEVNTTTSIPPPTENTSSQSNDSSGSNNELSFEPLNLETISYKDTLIENESTLLEIEMNHPVILSDFNVDAYDLMNEFYRNLFDAEKDYVLNHSIPLAKDDFDYSQEEISYPFYTHGLYSYYDVKTNNGKTLSILKTISEYTGGAHPNHFFSSSTFDVKTGKQVSLYDLLNLSKDSADELIFTQIEKTIEKQLANGDNFYFENYKENSRLAFNPDQFYVLEDRIYLYYQLYDLAPYALGIVTFEIIAN